MTGIADHVVAQLIGAAIGIPLVLVVILSLDTVWGDQRKPTEGKITLSRLWQLGQRARKK